MTTITINYLKVTIAQCEANVAVFQRRRADALAEYEARNDPHFKAWADLQSEAIAKNRAMAQDMKAAVAILEGAA